MAVTDSRSYLPRHVAHDLMAWLCLFLPCNGYGWPAFCAPALYTDGIRYMKLSLMGRLCNNYDRVTLQYDKPVICAIASWYVSFLFILLSNDDCSQDICSKLKVFNNNDGFIWRRSVSAMNCLTESCTRLPAFLHPSADGITWIPYRQLFGWTGLMPLLYIHCKMPQPQLHSAESASIDCIATFHFSIYHAQFTNAQDVNDNCHVIHGSVLRDRFADCNVLFSYTALQFRGVTSRCRQAPGRWP